MMMDVVVEIPMPLVIEASETAKKIDCLRKQAVFDLFPNGQWRINWVCGTNRGIGSDNGYGVGHTCKKNCRFRIPIHSFDTTTNEVKK